LAPLNFQDGSFDAVVMWHVLEHMIDPQTTVAHVTRLLRPGGVFLCAVPNFGSARSPLRRDKWFHLDVPRHLNHFTVPALRTLLATHGFVVERASYVSLEYDYFSFTQSVINRLGLRHNLLYNVLRGQPRQSPQARRPCPRGRNSHPCSSPRPSASSVSLSPPSPPSSAPAQP
jgi:SAM-dependent methyltransferase